jgi:hypothetical protein
MKVNDNTGNESPHLRKLHFPVDGQKKRSDSIGSVDSPSKRIVAPKVLSRF